MVLLRWASLVVVAELFHRSVVVAELLSDRQRGHSQLSFLRSGRQRGRSADAGLSLLALGRQPSGADAGLAAMDALDDEDEENDEVASTMGISTPAGSYPGPIYKLEVGGRTIHPLVCPQDQPHGRD